MSHLLPVLVSGGRQRIQDLGSTRFGSRVVETVLLRGVTIVSVGYPSLTLLLTWKKAPATRSLLHRKGWLYEGSEI